MVRSRIRDRLPEMLVHVRHQLQHHCPAWNGPAVQASGRILDNQVQVGHNVRIGAHSAVAGCVGIAGSADIGAHCTIGGAAMIHGHIRIADHVHVSAGTLISRSLTRPGTYTGIYPFDEHQSWKQGAAKVRRLGRGKSDG